MNKRKWLIAGAGVAVLAVVSAGAVMAQTPPTPTAGTTFLDRVAQKLGIDTPKLQSAITGAKTDQIDESVANGDLTQKQADALKAKVNSTPPNGFGGRGFGGFGGHGFEMKGARGVGDTPTSQQLADFLGITVDQLNTERKADGATLATVAQAHNKSRDELKGSSRARRRRRWTRRSRART